MQYKIKILLIIAIVLITSQSAFAEFKLILNFDDGYEGVYQNAFPLLSKYDLPAVVFVSIKTIGRERHLNLEQLQEFKNTGWEIGSHTINHSDLSLLTEKGLEFEIGGSYKYLQEHDLLERDYASFSSPMTVWNDEIARIVQNHYKLARGKKLIDYRLKEQTDFISKVILKKTSLSNIKLWITKAARNNQPIILIFHEVGIGGNQYFYPPDRFAAFVEMIKDYPVSTFYELN